MSWERSSMTARVGDCGCQKCAAARVGEVAPIDWTVIGVGAGALLLAVLALGALTAGGK